MKKSLVGIFLVFTFLTQGWGATKYVKSSMFSVGCAGILQSYSFTIQAAITAANAGDTISVCDGTYAENNIQITKDNLAIQSYSGNRNNVTVGTDGNSIFSIQAANITIKNLTINLNSNNSYGITDNYQASGSHTFENLAIATKDNAIYLQYNSSASVFNNLSITSSAGSGIYTAWNSDGMHSFTNINIIARTYGIYAVRGAGSFSNVVISAFDNALYLGSKYPTTFDVMSLTSTGGKGIYIQSNTAASNSYTISNATINSRSIAIDIDISGKDTIRDSNITSTNDRGINLRWDANGAHELSNLKVISKDIGIYSQQGLGLLNNITVSSTNGDGIYLGEKYPIVASGITVTQAAGKAFSVNTDATSGSAHTFSDLNLTAKYESLYVAKSGKLTINTIAATSTNGNALSLAWDAQGAHEILHATLIAQNGSGIIASHGISKLEDFNITAKSYGVQLPNYENTSIKRGFITTTSDHGIYIPSGSSKSVIIEDTVISAGAYGINLQACSSATINKVCVNKATIGIYSAWNANNVTITNTKIDVNSDYGVSINSDSSYKATITNNCFLKSPFAYRNNTVHTFNGNFWNGTPPSGYDTTPLSSCPVSSCYGGITPVPIADYRFDECSWNGTVSEVKDSSVNGYYGTLKLKTMTLENSKLCRGPAQFNDDSYIELSGFPNLTSSMTIAAWFKTTDITASGQRIFADDESNTGGYALSVGDAGSGTIRFYDRSQSSSGVIDSNAVLQNNTWYFVAGVTDIANAKRTLYLFDSSGNLIGTTPKVLNMTNTSRGSDSGVASIGGETASGETDNRFKGSIDEVKVYASALTQEQLITVIQNEIAGKNYDGTTRTCNTCGLATCFTETFDRTDLGSKWSIIKAENYTPNISANKLMLTSNIGNIAAGVSLVGDFPSADNLIEIEFEHNAYGGNGADGVVVVLSDANTTPVAGAYGGSLGYANRTGYSGFAGGWLGFGLDEYGNFSNPTEGRNGGPGFRTDAFVIRGSGSGQTGYSYITGTTTLTPGIDATVASNHKYKLTVDTRNNQTIVSVGRDTNNSGTYTSILTDANATQAASAPSKYKLSFTGSTGGSNNYHSFDNLSIKALQCGTLGQDQNVTNNFFDAWDTTGDIAHRSIQTKIVKKDFTLNVVGLNASNTAYQDFNGTVCARLVDSNDRNLTAWNKLLFTGANLQTTIFNSSYASKDSRVALSWKKNIDTTCPISVEDNNTKSTDHFAIRPKDFNISNATTAYAGDGFKLDFKARNNSNGASLDYNESKDGSFLISATIVKSGCSNGVLGVSNFAFVDGQKLAVDTNYSDVGDVNITIAEKSTFEFAKIDASDTSDTNRLITPVSLVVTVQPYELNITVENNDTNFTASTGKTWLYDSNVSDMYVAAKATVKANNKQHIALQNFTGSCYAQPVDLSFYYDVNNTNSNINLSYIMTNGTMASALKNISDINKTITLPASLFTTSSATAEYNFNIDRLYNTPLNPIDIALREVKVTSIAVAKDENNATVNKAARFYYGRIKTKDIVTDKTPVNSSVHVEVYSTTPLSDFYQNTLNWYINADDDGTTVLGDGNFSAKKGFSLSDANSSVSISGSNGYSNGLGTFNIANNSEKGATIHLAIPLWLWNNNYKDYNFTINSDCSQHPCFDYKFLENASGKKGITSGDFKGSTIGNEYNSTYQKTGVKTFR